MIQVVQPAHWTGVTKDPAGDVMVCGACPDWRACSDARWCARATPTDYVDWELRLVSRARNSVSVGLEAS